MTPRLAAVAVAGALLGPVASVGQATSIDVDVTVVPRPSTFGPLSIQRVQISFPDGRPEPLVPLDGRVSATAVIDYTGTGPLVGRWLVDGRPIGDFVHSLSFGGRLTVEVPAVPGLPTFEPGRHEVGLQISAPAVGFPLPVVGYVVEGAPGPGRGPIELVLPAAGATVPVPSRPPPSGIEAGVAFEWVQAGVPAPAYRFELGRVSRGIGGISAVVRAPRYVLPAAIATTLPRSTPLTWRVRAIDASGAELAASPQGAFSLRAASPIELLSPAEGERVRFPSRFSWSSSVTAASWEVRIHRNEEALQADLADLRNPRLRGAARILGGGPDPAAAPLLTVAGAADGTQVAPPAGPPFAPGAALRWIVIARDATGRFVAASDSGGFVVEPELRTVGGLPAFLEMAGQEIAVSSYAPESTAEALGGRGSVHFRLDRSRRGIPLSFQGLSAETWVERSREVTGSGLATAVTWIETLRGTVRSGLIEERPPQPLPMDLAGYAAHLSALRLSAGTASAGAFADLAIDLPSQARTPSGGAVALALPGTRLGLRGDFYVELGPGAAPDVRVETAASGPLRITSLGTLVADFAADRDFVGASGARSADGEVFAAGARAELPASALFPAIRNGLLRLARGLAAFLPSGFGATFDVADSDPVEPLVPAGYELVFTGGRITLAGGAVDGASLRLDGLVTLPAVERPPAGAVTIPFQGLAVSGTWIEGTVQAGDLQWGITLGAGAASTTLGAASALPLPSISRTTGGALAVAGPSLPQATGPAGATGSLGGSLGPQPTAMLAGPSTGDSVGILDPAPPGTARPPRAAAPLPTTGPAPAADDPPPPRPFVLRGGTGTLRLPFATQSPDRAQAGLAVRAGALEGPFELAPGGPKAAMPEDAVDLRIRASGVSGTIASAPAASGGLRDRRLPTRERTARMGDFDAAVSAFRVELADGAVVSSSVSGELRLPKPVELALEYRTATLSGTGDLMGATLVVPSEIPLPYWRASVLSPRAELSRSFLRLTGGALRLAVDAAAGGDELARIGLRTLDLGADGQIRAVTTDTATSFLGIPFALSSEGAIAFAPWSSPDVAPTPSQALVTLPGTLAFPSIGGEGAVIEHTPTGAAVRLADPKFARGMPDLIRITGDLTYVNGYPKGKAFKEFLGLGRVSILEALQLNGLVSIGADGQGLYERYGIGLGVDVDKAAAIYTSGGISLAAKLGAGVVAAATDKDPHAGEVGILVGDLARLGAGSFGSQDEMTQAMFKTLADAVRLARAIHLDTGGTRGDAVDTSLELGAATLSLAGDLAAKKAKLDQKQLAVLALTGLDAAFPILERSGFAKDQPETLAVLGFLRLGVKATRLWMDDGKLSDKDWFSLMHQMFRSARKLSADRTYVVAMDVMAAVFTAAEKGGANADAVSARVAASILGVVRQAQVLPGNDWKNVLALTQALLDGVVTAQDLPSPENGIAVARAVLGAAAGSETDFGAGDGEKVKLAFRLALRTLDAWAAATGGIPYDKAAISVKDAWDTTATAAEFSGGPRFGVHETAWRLLDVWDRVKVRSVAETVADLRQVLCDAGSDICVSGSGFAAQVAGVLGDARGATTPAALAGAVQRLGGLAAWASGAGTPEGSTTSHLDRMRALVQPDAASLRANAASLTASALLPSVAAASSLEEAGTVATLASGLAHHASRAGALLGISDLDWDVVVRDPVAAALDARITGQFAREVRAAAAATSDPRKLGDLWVAWRKATWFVPDFPGAPGASAAEKRAVEQAFVGKGEELYQACAARIAAEPYAQWSAARLCMQDLLRLPGTADAGIRTAMQPVIGTMAELLTIAIPMLQGMEQGRVDTLRTFQIYLLALGGVFLETDAMSKEMAEVPTSRAAPDPIRRWIEDAKASDGAAVGRLLDTALADARAGQMHEGTLFVLVLARGVYERGIDLGPDTIGRLAELQRTVLPLADRTFSSWLAEVDPEQTSITGGLDSAARYALLARLPGRTGAHAALEAKVPGWIAAAKQLPCDRRMERGAWLRAVAPFVPGKYADIQALMGVLHRGCTTPSYDPSTEIAKIIRSGNELRQAVDGIATGPMVEGDKKEAIAWAIAERLETLTAGFTGEIAEERVLRATHEQVALVRKYRLRSRAERVQAVGDVLKKAVAELAPKQSAGNAAKAVEIAVAILKEFVASGAEAKPGWQRALEIASIAVSQQVPSKEAKALLGAWIGLIKANADTPADAVTIAAVPPAMAAGIGLVLMDKVRMSGGKVDLPATLSAFGLEGEFWEAIGQNVPALVEVVIAAGKLDRLFTGVRKASSGDLAARMAAVRKLVEEAPKLERIGKYVGAVLKPEAHLLAPDTDQREYLSNALLALLGTARADVPGSPAWPDKSTCAAVAQPVPPGGTVARGREVLVCALDVSREVVRGFVAVAVSGSPTPYQLLDAQARQAREELQRDAVFARAIGDEGLSGLSGGLEYRGGELARFELYASLDVARFIETAMLAEYDTRQGLFRLRLANVDPRPRGALDRLGLTVGANRLLDSSAFGSPLKTLEITVSGPSRCFAGKLALGMETPIGGFATGESALTVCGDPFAFDFQVAANTSPTPPFASSASLRLCYGSGNAGLDLGLRAGLEVGDIIPEPVFVDGWGRSAYVKWWGLSGMLGIQAGLTAGTAGLEIRGGASAEIGVRVSEKDEPNCVGVPLVLGTLFPGSSFEPRSTHTTAGGRRIAYGLCRSSYGASAEFRAGTAQWQGFYVKSRTAVNAGLATLRTWTYKSGPAFDWGLGDFPSDRYGGWPVAGTAPAGTASVCGVTR